MLLELLVYIIRNRLEIENIRAMSEQVTYRRCREDPIFVVRKRC